MIHLGIETSCDDCSIAVLDDLNVLSLSTFAQNDLHRPFGGIVPEIASRKHLETFLPTMDIALREAGGISWSDIEIISVTNRPGLLGSLLVGLTGAKALAYLHDKPMVPVHHLEAHLCSLFLTDRTSAPVQASFPLLVLLASGGHTQLYLIQSPPEQWSECVLQEALLGQSLDDAAGEAFDKTAKMLGFDYPGGPHLDQNATGGDPHAFAFPRPLKHQPSFDYSFSGLKTAVALEIQRQQLVGSIDGQLRKDFCASIQEAIVDTLMQKVVRAIEAFEPKAVAVVGGVAANSALRKRLQTLRGIEVITPPLRFCTDNGAMVAAAGWYRHKQGLSIAPQQALTLTAFATAVQ